MIVGRFAPSPSGPLHMGSLLTALASYLDVKSRGGEWYVRFDDIDPPRQDPLAIEHILRALAAHGFEGDRPVDYQSEHDSRYKDALQALTADCFYCTCSRRSLAGTKVYPGTCRSHQTPRADAAIRLRSRDRSISFNDQLHGPYECHLARDHGDCIIKRRDGLWAYHLATAVDDGMDVTHVMRGEDLIDSTPVHIDIMERLGLTVPQYAHLPVLCFADGSKLSKQSHAPAIDNQQAAANLREALRLLGQQPPEQDLTAAGWLDWGRTHWQLDSVPRQLSPFTENP